MLDAILKPASVKAADTPLAVANEAPAGTVQTANGKDAKGREVQETDEHGPVIVKKQPAKPTLVEKPSSGDRSVDDLFGE